MAPVVYNGIEPNTRNCQLTPPPFCGEGSVLSDGDIGPTDSVDVSDPDQVHRFFVWHRDNGQVTLLFSIGNGAISFNVYYIDIYTLSVPSARIGSPGNISFTTFEGPLSNLSSQSCSFSSSTNTLSRNTITLSEDTFQSLLLQFPFTNPDIDWLFISEIQLCAGEPPANISCDTSTSSTILSPYPVHVTPTSSFPTHITPSFSSSPTGFTASQDSCNSLMLVTGLVVMAILLVVAITTTVCISIYHLQWRKRLHTKPLVRDLHQTAELGEAQAKPNVAYGQILNSNTSEDDSKIYYSEIKI